MYAARRRRIVTPFFELFRGQTEVPPVNINIIIMTRATLLRNEGDGDQSLIGVSNALVMK